MSKQRVLLIGGVSIVKGRVKDSGQIMREICDDLEPTLNQIDFVKNAPFKTISLIIRFGSQDNLVLDYEPINKRYSELPVAIELELARLRKANKEEIKEEFYKVTKHVLNDVAKKYRLLPFNF